MHGINQRVGSIEHWATNQASASTTPSSQSDLSSSTKLITTLASELPNPKLLGPGASVTQMTAWKQSITDKYAPLINGLSSQQKRDMPPHVNPAQVQLYIKHVFRGYGLAESIISDRDSLFTSDYWLAFHRAIETTLKDDDCIPPPGRRTDRGRQPNPPFLPRLYTSPLHTDWRDGSPMPSSAITTRLTQQQASHRTSSTTVITHAPQQTAGVRTAPIPTPTCSFSCSCSKTYRSPL